MSKPIPEQLAEWRRESVEEFVPVGPVVPRLHHRIRTLLDALEEAEKELDARPRITVRHGTLPPLEWDE